MPRLITPAACLLIVLALASPAAAQDPARPPAQDPVPPLPDPVPPPLQEEPIGRFVFDARGTMARFKQVPAIGTALGVDAGGNLPGRGFGLLVGAHSYPLRARRVALGIGGEVMLRTQGSRTAPSTVKDGPDGPTVTTRMTALSPQVSVNFGKRDGWSYISGGIGWATFSAEREDKPLPDADTRPLTINYGGGARWFAKKHLAFSLDVRLYAIRPQDGTAARPAFPRMTIMVFSAGLSAR